uniref:Carbamoyl phosphate synthase small chain n=1 Tax=Mastocarpus papillatus TaxID=31436 RepID=A0A342RZ95_9FLOR|nr:carbamoyl-phosphate synthase small chain [Mastocarpus papillatus]AOL58041.1 carbamoyl-phosphate synthase small chain [Mastocarpus papillatus]
MKCISYPTILYLQDGTRYNGWSYISSLLSIGEVVFNTGMTGYQEIITDPSYSRQIIAFTYPEIGNTGINHEDYESNKIHIKGIIAKNICSKPSSWRKQLSFIEYILDNKIPHIFGIDTRSLTKHLRKYGVMNGCISNKILDKDNLEKVIHKFPSMERTNLANLVTTTKKYQLNPIRTKQKMFSYLNCSTYNKCVLPINIAVIDFGVKYNILSRLIDYGCNVTVLPANSKYEEIKLLNPDGVLLSNGPGDPSTMIDAIRNIKILIESVKIPIFGICMGHQILSLALGGQTFKLKFGHRGLNHPTGTHQKAEITSQNHGFAVNSKSLISNNLKIIQFNLNDFTVAGIIHKYRPIFSVQYHPEASPGPHDSDHLFNHFINLIKLTKFKQNI